MSGKLRELVTWGLKANIIVLAVDLPILIVIRLFQGSDLPATFRGYFPAMLLVEAAVIFIIGGLIPLSSTIFFSRVRKHFLHSNEEWSVDKHKESEERANYLILTGIFLSLESLAVSALFL
jgi:hypothetical protein